MRVLQGHAHRDLGLSSVSAEGLFRLLAAVKKLGPVVAGFALFYSRLEAGTPVCMQSFKMAIPQILPEPSLRP